MRHFPLRELGYAIGVIVVSAALYVGAYYAMVQRGPVLWLNTLDLWDIETKADYRFAQETSEVVFGPINDLDRVVRPGYWSPFGHLAH